MERGTGTQEIGKHTSLWILPYSYQVLEPIVFFNDCQNTEVFMLAMAGEFLSS